MPDWDIIAKYLAGEASDAEKESVEDWISRQPVNRALLNSLQVVIRPRKGIADFTDTLEEDWQKISDKTHAKSVTSNQDNSFSWKLTLKIAAGVLILLLTGIGTWKFTINPSQQVKLVAGDSVRFLQLSDGSKIWLNKKSWLILHDNFGTRDRKITLDGEAYLEVAKDKDRPFIVYSESIKATVLGTAFNFNAADQKTIIVTVTEGQVAVENSGKTMTTLLPGEAIHCDIVSNEFIKQVNDNLNFLTWKTGVIRFESASLQDVCEYMSQFYSIDLRADDAAKNLQITTVLDNMTSQQAIGVISMTLDLQVQNSSKTIIFAK